MKKTKAIRIITLLVIVAAIAGGIYLFSTTNRDSVTTQSRASTGTVGGASTTDSCGLIQVTASESQACPDLAKEMDKDGNILTPPVLPPNEIKSYTTTFTLKNVAADNKPHAVKYLKMSFFCKGAYGQAVEDPKGSGKYRAYCIETPVITEETVTLQPGETKDVVVTTNNGGGAACGTFQNDITYGTFQNDITISSVDTNTQCNTNNVHSVAAWGFCQTGKSCPAPTSPTPMPPTGVQPTTPPLEGCGSMTLTISDGGSCAEPTKVPEEIPEPIACGSPCNTGRGNETCGEGHVCTLSKAGGYYCARKEFQQYCAEYATEASCCTEPSATPIPTSTPIPTATTIPTATPYPTQVPQQPQVQQQVVQQQQQPVQVIQQQVPVVQVQPTYTPVPPPPTFTVIPTHTPYPTQPPQPSYTPIPPPPVAGNPIPFLVVGVPVVLLLLGLLL